MSLEGTKQLYEALIKARAEFPPILKTNKREFKNKYEDLNDIYNEIIDILTKYNLYIEMGTDVIINNVTGNLINIIKARAVHSLSEKSTDWSRFSLVLPDSKINDKKHESEGGLQTYTRRYQIKLILNICGENDDRDGQSSDTTYDNTSGSGNVLAGCISTKQLGLLRHKLNKDTARELAICKHYGIASLELLPWQKMNELVEILDKGQ